MEKILHLTLKKKWFDMIASGEKKEEYREIKLHWIKRLIWFHDYSIFEDPIRWAEFVECFPNHIGYDSHHEMLNNYTAELAWFQKIIFRNGYRKDAPTLTVQCLGIEIGEAKPEWSDNWKAKVFIIKLGSITNQ